MHVRRRIALRRDSGRPEPVEGRFAARVVGTFDVTKLAWPKTKEGLLAQLRDLGLSLTAERRSVDVLVAEPARQ